MAFERLAAHIDFIEKSLANKMSPRAIAKELGEPGLYQTIQRYKTAVFDLNKEATAAWRQERAKSHEARLEEGKATIVDSLEVINLGKLRAKQLLALEHGQDYETAQGEERKLSWGSAVIYWQTGQKMICELSRAEAEIAGEDPESRKATAIESLSEAEIDARLIELAECASTPKARGSSAAKGKDRAEGESRTLDLC